MWLKCDFSSAPIKELSTITTYNRSGFGNDVKDGTGANLSIGLRYEEQYITCVPHYEAKYLCQSKTGSWQLSHQHDMD